MYEAAERSEAIIQKEEVVNIIKLFTLREQHGNGFSCCIVRQMAVKLRNNVLRHYLINVLSSDFNTRCFNNFLKFCNNENTKQLL